jgi:multiple sugar transport system permease protein
LIQVILPTALPGVVAVAVYAFMTAWGEVLFASVMTNENSRTLAVGLRSYATEQDVYWNQVMAALVVSVPVVIGFLALQRRFVAGLTAGAVK